MKCKYKNVDFGNFFLRVYLPLKDSVKGGLLFPGELTLENSADSYLCFLLVLLHSDPLSITFFISMLGFLFYFI